MLPADAAITSSAEGSDAIVHCTNSQREKLAISMADGASLFLLARQSVANMSSADFYRTSKRPLNVSALHSRPAHAV
jgi:hypothetical protein